MHDLKRKTAQLLPDVQPPSEYTSLCVSCRSIRLETISGRAHNLHKDWNALEASATRCEVCQVILNTILVEAREQYPKQVNQYLQQYGHAAHMNVEPDPTSISLPADWYAEVDSSVWLELTETGRLEVSLGEPDVIAAKYVRQERSADVTPVQSLVEHLWQVEIDSRITEGDALFKLVRAESRQPLASSSIDDKAMRLAREWTTECIKTHTTCVTTNKLTDIPRRLVDLGRVEDSRILSLVTVEEKCPSYAALSYSWGPDRDFAWIQYVHEVQDSFDGIELTRLPILLQEIVHITIKQGFQYLWIDCLCILQRDAEDWAIESAKMGGIYEGCDLMFCTTGCVSCNESVLKPRTRMEREGAVLPINSENGSHVGTIHLQQTKLKNALGPESRAWCLQELRLAPRVLHVCHDELIYQCRAGNYVESRGMTFEPKREWMGMPHEVAPSIYGPYGSCKPRADIMGVVGWAYIVTDYTKRNLTMSSDKLIAISGLAQKAQQSIRSRYLAGIWEKYLHIGLSWSAGDDFVYPNARRPPQHRAPSWSWASVDGAVSWRILDLPLYVYLDRGEIDPFDKSRSAIEVTEIVMGANEHDACFEAGTMEIHLIGSISRIASSKLLANERLNSYYVMTRTTPKFGHYYHDEGQILQGDIICLHLLVQNLGSTPGLPEGHVMLLLEEASDNRYKRIGSGIIYDESVFGAVQKQPLILI